MAVTKVLIVVSTYPLPSRSYDELVCTAGILEDGSWIRIYPVRLSFLSHSKYQWVELDLEKRTAGEDFRPESYRPRYTDLRDMKVLSSVGTDQSWYERKGLCLNSVYTNMTQLIDDSKEPKNVSLAVFKPARFIKFIAEPDSADWSEKWQSGLNQYDLFANADGTPQTQPRTPIDKIPFKFKYQFEDDSGKRSTMTIEDWEIGALFRNCKKRADGNLEEAKDGVVKQYGDTFLGTKELYLFLGTTLEHHRSRHNNPFTITGVFYPPKTLQQDMF